VAKSSGKPAAAVVARLAELFRRNGYVRMQDPKRLKKEGYGSYKKGDEIRLVAETKAELAEVRKLLKAAGFEPGKPFEKATQYAQPIYGREPVARFMALVKVKPAAKKKATKSR